MKSKGLLFMTAFIIVVMFVAAVAQTGQAYEDKAGKYKLLLYGDWKAVNYNDAVGRPKTEFVFRDRAEGLLKIASQPLEGSLADMVKAEEENQHIYRAGFGNSETEPFGGGALTGMRLSFDTSEGPRQMANTTYFLQDKNMVYILRFTGKRGIIDRNRNLTDQVARSLQPLP